MSLREQLKSKPRKFIIAIDYPETIRNVSKLKHLQFVAAIKVGLPVILSHDLKIIQKLKNKSKKPLILDLKISDIPEISGPIVQQTIRLGCDAIIVQGFVGKEVIKRCVEECEKISDVIVFVVTGMTHEKSESNLTNLHAEDIARWAKEAGAHGIIVPANKPDQIKKLKEIVKDDLLVIAAGIGRQGGDPDIAINSGADSYIIGESFDYPTISEKILKLEFILKISGIFLIVGAIILFVINSKYLVEFVIAVAVGLVLLLISKYDEL